MAELDYTHQLERSLQVCKTLHSIQPLDALLQTLIEATAELVDSEESSILLYDKEHHCLRFAAAPSGQLSTLKNLGVPVDRSVAGWVYTYGRPVKLNQADSDERIFRVVDREVSESTLSLLAVPLIYRGETVGVLEAVNKHNNDDYTGEDLFILESLAAQAAIAIQSQRMLDQAQQENQRMVELDQLKSDWTAILVQELRDTTGLILSAATEIHKETSSGEFSGPDEIFDAAARLKDLAGKLDGLEHFEKATNSLQVEPVEAQALVRRVVEVFQETAAARNIALLVDVPDGLVFDADAAKIAVALRNLVENAVTFTQNGGWVRVRVEALPGFVRFAVIDRGVGIPEQEHEKIFERFYQVRPQPVRHNGAGLGLPIAKEMVELHGGEIWVESEDGLGSTFAFMIPEMQGE